MTDGRTDGARSGPHHKKPRAGNVGVHSAAARDVPQKPFMQGGKGVIDTEMSERHGERLKAPFPWFGGKSRAADLIWRRLGDVDSYNEPFAGSLAVLLGRPTDPSVETVNDLDAYLANFWRALQADPEQVAYWADYPVNETDLHARHLWLVNSRRARASMARVKADSDYFNAKIAGWWVWGQCLWIGSGWCSRPDWEGRGVGAAANRGVHNKRMSGTGNGQGVGVHRVGIGAAPETCLRPDGRRDSPARIVAGRVAGKAADRGVHAPTLTDQKRPKLRERGTDGVATHEWAASGGLYDYLQALAIRLRRVRVCCGDWKRVLTPSVTTYVGLTGVLLDPPYSHEMRERCYSEDHDISAEVRKWAVENGDNPEFRIALCGYDGEHNAPDVANPIPDTWECVEWKAHGGYSRTERGKANRERERIWFSPHCLKAELPLFADLSA